jgi:hypothetical protein
VLQDLRDRLVQKAYCGDDIGNHMPIQDIEAWIVSSPGG